MSPKRITILAVLAVLILFIFLPVRFPFSITAPGKILLSNEWILYKGPDGRLLSTLIDHQTGVAKNYTIAQVERGDAGGFNFHSAIAANKYIEAGDTIGQFYSNEVERQYARLEGELNLALSSLALYTSGEKPSVIKEAEQRLQFSIKEAEERRKISERQRKLFEQQLISQEELEISQLSSQLAEIRSSISEAQFQTASTGVKQEQVDYLRSRIKMLRAELRTLNERLNSFVLISPIPGIIHRTFSGDTLAVIGDTTGFIMFMPLKLKDLRYVAKNRRVEIELLPSGNSMYGEIINIDNAVHTLNGTQAVFVTAGIGGDIPEIFPGLIARCTIPCEPLTALQYLKRTATSITFQ